MSYVAKRFRTFRRPIRRISKISINVISTPSPQALLDILAKYRKQGGIL